MHKQERPQDRQPQQEEESPVRWFENQLKLLLATCFVQALHLCIEQLRPILESAVFDILPKDRASQPRSLFTSKKESVDSVLSILNNYLLELQSNFVGFGLVKQFFEQVFGFMDAVLFDALLLQKVPRPPPP